MSIRNATLHDYEAIKELLNQLDYTGTDSFLLSKMELLINQPNSQLLVYDLDAKVVAFIAIDFITQLALQGDFARITYFAVDRSVRNVGIGKQMEDYCEDIARSRNCDRMEVHCHQRRLEAHRFYYRQGYTESPKYLVKSMQ